MSTKTVRKVSEKAMKVKKINFICKRDGRIVPFTSEKITSAISKAFLAVRDENIEGISLIARKVIGNLENIFVGKISNVEEVQDVITNTLANEGYNDVAAAYSEYRQKRQEIREAKYFLMYRDIKTVITNNAKKVLDSRYLRKDANGKKIRVMR